jgi:hypothetical protein
MEILFTEETLTFEIFAIFCMCWFILYWPQRQTPSTDYKKAIILCTMVNLLFSTLSVAQCLNNAM